MTEFILNNETIQTDKPSGYLLLDLIRYDKSLTGTKIGCREGDCGACTILIGEIVNGKMKYISATSCLTPIGNVHGKHVVTIEGLNMDELSPVQQAMVDESGTQCGFCTVGFVVSLSGHCMENTSSTYDSAIASIDGNICRCTGYKSIERAAERLNNELKNKDDANLIDWLIGNNFIPSYFLEIPERLEKIQALDSSPNGKPLVGGGTDLYVQKPDDLVELTVSSVNGDPSLRSISLENGKCMIGGGCTVTDILDSELTSYFPNLARHIKLVSSSPIRNISTLAGNFVNASPIGDFTAFFLALNAQITLMGNGGSRSIFLKDFYKGYKELDKNDDEIISQIEFDLPRENSFFNFEKISKREHLDIASVNSAATIVLKNDTITEAHISAGGVAPIPKYLTETCAYLHGKEISPETIKSATEIIQSEISPISDARGSADYKRLLLRQLFFAHFIELFPDQITMDLLK